MCLHTEVSGVFTVGNLARSLSQSQRNYAESQEVFCITDFVMDWAEIIGHMRSYLLKKNYTSNAFYEQMIKTYRSKIVTVVLCGCEICPYIRKNRQIVDV